MEPKITCYNILEASIAYAKEELGDQCYNREEDTYDRGSYENPNYSWIFYDGDARHAPEHRHLLIYKEKLENPHNFSGKALFKMRYESGINKLYFYATRNTHTQPWMRYMDSRDKLYAIPLSIKPYDEMERPRVKRLIKRIGNAIINLYEEIDDIDAKHTEYIKQKKHKKAMQTQAIIQALHTRISALELASS
jgi:hypothetical protein